MSKLTELFSDASKWTTGAYARDKGGKALVTGTDPQAVCFCLLGGLEHCYASNTDDGPNFYLVMSRVHEAIGHTSIPAFNDRHTTTFEMVKALVTELDI